MARQHRKLPHPSAQDIQRFWNKINKEPGQGPNGECWEWQAGKQPDGYAQIGIGRSTFYIHRVAYLIQFGVDPGAQLVCHRCDNRACCRGDHLFLGDDKANILDCVRKGRRARTTKPPKGVDHHKTTLTERQVREIRAANQNGVSEHQLAAMYGVHRSAINSICRRRTWKHIP